MKESRQLMRGATDAPDGPLTLDEALRLTRTTAVTAYNARRKLADLKAALEVATAENTSGGFQRRERVPAHTALREVCNLRYLCHEAEGDVVSAEREAAKARRALEALACSSAEKPDEAALHQVG